MTQGELAAREGVSAARVSQVLMVLRLDRSILSDLMDPASPNPVPPLKELHAIGRLDSERAQVTRYRDVCEAIVRKKGGAAVKAMPQRGFQHLFVQARAWQAALDADEVRSLAELAQRERQSRHQVARVLDLLTLPDDIQAALDVPPQDLPSGATQAMVRKLVKLGDAEAQRSAWSALFAPARASAK